MIHSAEHWVKGKRILVTRPQRQSERLAKAIDGLGGIALKLPVIEIAPLKENEIARSTLLDIDLCDLVIVTSPNAAQLLLGWLDKYWPQLPQHPGWIAVGAATAAVLDAAGMTAQIPTGSATSEGVLEMAQLQHVAGRKVLIVKGEGGRTRLYEELARRGARVENLALYRREQPEFDRDTLLQVVGAPDAMIATSVDVLKSLDELLGRTEVAHHGIPLVVASERIRQVAERLGYRRIFLANGATDESILDALNVIG